MRIQQVPKRVSFLIDGFNLYHSVCQAIHDGNIVGGKWLDLWSLCKNYLYIFGKDAIIQDVYYFSALALHTSDKLAPVRHQTLIEALEASGVQVILGKFKRKQVKCKAICRKSGWGYEEKETDVNIAIKLIELLMTNTADVIVIISGDTDLATAVRAAKRLFPNKKIGIGFPYKRANAELKQIAHHSFKIDAQYYQKFVFPDSIMLASGKTLIKPPSW